MDLERYTKTKKMAIICIITNIFLSIFKLSIGIISMSQSMITDGLNSVQDTFSAIMTFIGNKIACKPNDTDHPFGHGKSEYIFSMLVGIFIVFVYVNMISNIISNYLSGQRILFSIWLMIVCIFALIIKLILFLYTRKIAKIYKNMLALVNSKEYRNDMLITSGTFISILFSNIFWIDVIVSILVSVFMIHTGIKVFIQSYKVLMDTNMENSVVEKIKEEILLIDGVEYVERIVAKPTGFNYIIIVRASVIGDLTVKEGDSIANNIKKRVNEIDLVNDTIINIIPY
ncbi:MAG: cation diffusion facilitator family transporter [Clostridia bacterium]|nr:cation diffusion facilitator family transporter [Clostridia bacterium]